MFDLSAKERFFRLRETRGSRKIRVKHVFRLPTLQDWEKYFRGVSTLGLSRGRDTIEYSGAIQERNVELWDSLILRVEGYELNGENVMRRDDWKELIPLPHKTETIGGFVNTWRKEEDIEEAEVLDLGSDSIDVGVIVLTNDGDEIVQTELRFYFSSPDMSDYKQMSRMTSRMRLTRTKERNVSSISVPTDIKPYIKIFDKLIQKVEGYVFEGDDLMKQSGWRDLIDASHKRAAIDELFTVEFEEQEGKV